MRSSSAINPRNAGVSAVGLQGTGARRPSNKRTSSSARGRGPRGIGAATDKLSAMRQESFDEFFATSAEVAGAARRPSADGAAHGAAARAPDAGAARTRPAPIVGGTRVTPMLEQYRAAKRDAPPDALLF
ncbi:MAG: hypothetical protein EPO68_10915, partial [Planctomycetota bacterium]